MDTKVLIGGVMDAKEVGARVRYFREKKNMTKNALAIASGVSPTYIHQIEAGLKCPTVEYLSHICWGLGITLKNFFSQDGEAVQDKLSYLTPEQKNFLNAFLNSL